MFSSKSNHFTNARAVSEIISGVVKSMSATLDAFLASMNGNATSFMTFSVSHLDVVVGIWDHSSEFVVWVGVINGGGDFRREPGRKREDGLVLEIATNNFDDKNCIGKGGFGKVYKGELLPLGIDRRYAVKRLERLDPRYSQGHREFWKEIVTLSLYKHENIVSLLGFCDENDEKILIYEYASKGSLDKYLSNNDLRWIQRLKICIQAARGLAYLHDPNATHQRVLHRDVKSANILLDENWNAKISDFGLSKFGPANQRYSFVVSDAVGTFGYCDPVYVETGLLTKESDVYSFGVVLFEVLCGRLCYQSTLGGRVLPFIGLVRMYYKEQKLHDILHVSIKDEITNPSFQEFTKVAYECLSMDPKKRPLMTDVLSKLERALQYQYQPIGHDKAAATMGQAKEMVMVGMKKPIEKVDPALEKADDTFHVLREKLKEEVLELVDEVDSMLDEANDTLDETLDLVSELADSTLEKVDPVLEKVDDTFHVLREKLKEEVLELVDEVDSVLDEANDTLDETLDLVSELADSTLEKVDPILEKADDTFHVLREKLKENVLELVDEVDSVLDEANDTLDLVSELADSTLKKAGKKLSKWWSDL
ncbi:hypothetical protein QVD17_13799 [Tagetes erecta]|uniref:Protein kinase domain-containing protein n=1 Tax=Tagetes erecta TaxID=13708 RepID=A0AAD8P3P0_TARER|nr:hypothetical protein QVD17_13799 [Tagetes erecta]